MHVLPVEAGFVGPDNVAVLIAEQPHDQDEVLLIVDIGTNGEIVLGNRHRLFSASCATGPAFEGGCIKHGMRAAHGSIDKVRIDPETLEVRFRVIGSESWSTDLPEGVTGARGICGSGIIDAVAEMLAAGVIQANGGFEKARASARIRKGPDGVQEFVVARAEETVIGQDITVTQQDVRSIQLAKAALFAGSLILMRRMGVEQPDRVVLAGAFGTEIDTERALAIGMFPDCGKQNILAVGNAAGEGACMALLNREKRSEAERVAREVEYVELTTEPDFMNTFVNATRFPDRS
ncbi:MAG: ASKHA domain-containing protein [Thermodesulfobacteriota bacterium]